MTIIRELGDYGFNLAKDEHMHLVFLLKNLSGKLSASFRLAEGAKLQIEQIIIGGKTDCSLSYTLDKNAQLEQSNALKLSNNDTFNFAYFADHVGENSQSSIKIIGSLDDRAQKQSELKIHFAKGATGAFGSEAEKITLLGKQTRNVAIPTILSDESEAQGRHSFSSGHISEDELNYLQSRGLPSDKIKEIMARGELLKIAKLTKSPEIIQEFE
jgi:Fe-S cluster assembly scaffold protein SufB